jgi:hypothetical protein
LYKVDDSCDIERDIPRNSISGFTDTEKENAGVSAGVSQEKQNSLIPREELLDDKEQQQELLSPPGKPRKIIEKKEFSPDYLRTVEEEYKGNLKARESKYPKITPRPGMIEPAEALKIAAEHNSGSYDIEQRPKIELDGDSYIVTFWKHRRPYLNTTGFYSITEINAWTGEIESFLLSAD